MNMKRNFNENHTRHSAGYQQMPLYTLKKQGNITQPLNPIESEFYSCNEYLPTQHYDPSFMSSGMNVYPSFLQAGSEDPLVHNSQQLTPETYNLRSYATQPGKLLTTLPRLDSGTRRQLFNPGSWKEDDILMNRKQNDVLLWSGQCQGRLNANNSWRNSPNDQHCFLQQVSPSWTTSEREFQWPVPTSNTFPKMAKYKNASCSVKPSVAIEYHKKSQVMTSQPVKIQTTAKNTLRILTASIEKLKEWSHYCERVPLLFEVFATLDSAVTSDKMSAKNFLLRDERATVQCVFYEIDRDLPRFIRGQVHRCVGNYDRKNGKLKCVSVRPATTLEQKKFIESVRVSDIEVKKFIANVKEI
ncbi:spermatogenesis-associated protein 22 [Erpetoichthys calabaricus]|uniref:Spermatogenesis associated 22 n=1 Tax=Erpetoichthys calabaricus TaxID=27687 RepID=A0A8C4SBC0_ERPCA|nr:spermatogenesis-associated protein 22 [Erpetoichthys calabaricus]XP_051786866.1 spermatogenesis-associated protein 22 [Erpetoichthys calabaricus]XP_051786867.1 spermatogenesis-associated protein 22 [Erpetoichthys calabaricus]